MAPLVLRLAACVALAFALLCPAAAQELTGTLKKVRDSRLLVIGYRENAFPFSYLNARRQPVGYTIDLCLAIVDEIAAELEGREFGVNYKPVTAESRIPALIAGDIDLECGATTNNVERQKQVAFSPIIFVAGTKLLVKRGSRITSYRDLRDRMVVVTAGTTNEAALRKLSEKQNLGIKLVVAKDHGESYAIFASGRADAFATDDVLLYGLIAREKAGADFHVVGEYLSYDPYGIMYRKDDPALAEVIDRTFRKLAESRDIVQIYDKWFMRPLPDGVRLGLPMSAQLEEMFRVIGLPD
jgi:glutamate/aspartate transport system substrate-binding protein